MPAARSEFFILAKMNISLNMRLAIPNKMEGIGWYSYEIARRLIHDHPEVNFQLLYDRKIPDFEFHQSKNVSAHKLFPPARRPFLWKYWFNKSVSKFLSENESDIFLSFDGYLSLNTKVKQISVIHDLNFEHFPEDMPPTYLAYYQKYFPRFAKKATRIVTVSEFSKKDIAEQYTIEHDKIEVVPNAVKEGFKEISDQEKQKTKEEFADASDFILFVGSIHPRKNLKRLCEAFDLFKKSHNTGHKLLIVGASMWKDSSGEFLNQLSHHEDIVILGRQSQANVCKITASAELLAYTSYFEGFGVPILEAFASGTPVLCSNTSAMPEVAGKAAVYVDPFDVEDIANKLGKTLANKALQSTLVSEGKTQLEKFSWDKSAKKMWELIEKCL